MKSTHRLVITLSAAVMGLPFALVAACHEPSEGVSEAAGELTAAPTVTTPPTATGTARKSSGITFNDAPGNSKHPVEGSTAWFVEKTYGAGSRYTYALAGPSGSAFPLPHLVASAFPINPLGGAHALPARTEIAVCNTAFRERTPSDLQNILTTCAVYRPDGVVTARRAFQGQWFKAFAVRNGKLEIRLVPRLEYFREHESDPDCSAVDVSATNLALRADKVFCNPARDVGTACFTSEEAAAATPSSPDGHRDARGYCVEN